jgi:type IV pilus assembly protein PilY1
MTTNKTVSRSFTRLGVAAWTAIYFVFAGLTSTSMADDSTIYVNRFPTTGIPNILFVLDSSGSMTETVASINKTRMDAVKEAMETIINSEGNIKMGLARFHYYLGGPIIFPVTGLNTNPAFLDDNVAVATITGSSDDAEEMTTGPSVGTVSLDDPSLEMTVSDAFSSAVVDTYDSNPAPGGSADDDEIGSSGAGISSIDLDIAGNTAGINFKNIPVERDAVILSAQVVFTARTTQTSTAHTVIRGHDADDPGNFSVQPLSTRLTEVTAAGVPWSNIEPVSAGGTVTSPNLRSIIQEIVSRPGYPLNGGGNIALIFENGTGNREFWSYDGSPQDGPSLVITWARAGVTNLVRRVQNNTDDAEEYVASGQTRTNGNQLGMATEGGQQQLIGLRFIDVQIPPNATILRADIDMTVRLDGLDDPSWIAPADLRIWGDSTADAAPFANNSTNGISGRASTTAAVLWDDVLAPRAAETLQTADISSIVQEIVGPANGSVLTGWASGNALVVAIEEGPGLETGTRSICSRRGTVNGNVCPEGLEFRPTLNVWYALPTATGSVNQTVGLRFDNVTVPQGAAITQAFIEFQAGAVSTEPGSGLTIAVENSANAVPYSNSPFDITGRTYGNTAVWNGVSTPPLTSWEAVDAVKQSVDVSSLVSQVTGRTDWCGGNAMAFSVTSADAKLVAHAFDAAPSKAPILRVLFDTSGLTTGQGCVKQRTVSLITDGNGDVEELATNGSIRLFDDALDLDPNGNYVGFRFKDIQIPRGATINNAFLTFSSYQNDTGAANLQIQVQPHPNPPAFTDAANDVTDRVSGATAANWAIAATGEDWVEGVEYSTPAVMTPSSLKDLMQPIIDGSVVVDGQQWAPGNAMVFVVRNTGAFDRDIASVNINTPTVPKRPAELVIEWEANLGDVNFPALNTRQKMIQAVNEIQPRGATPTTDVMFEAASYFEGRPVHWGRTRGAGNTFEPLGPTNNTDLDSQITGWTDDQLLKDGEFGRLSHPASYAPVSPINRFGSCTFLNPNDPACRNEHVDNGSGPNYASPFATATDCEKGFIILLSDGRANRNSSRDLIRSLIGAASCAARIPTIDTAGDVVPGAGGNPFVLRDPTSDELCAVDLAAHLFAQDYIPGGADVDFTKNNVKTFTVGLDLPLTSTSNRQAVEYLKAIAFAGQGGNFSNPTAAVPYGTGYFDAGNAADLSVAFDNILTQIVDETTSFVAPGLSINAFNRLFNREDVYFSLFKPAETVAWQGNMKKFRLCTVPPGTPSPSCAFGEIIDENGDPAVFDDPGNLDTFGTLKDTADGFWSPTGARGPVIDEGGAGELIPTWTSRAVYVNTSNATVPAPDYVNDPVQSQGTALHKLTVSGGSADVGADPATNALKQALVNAGNCGPITAPDDACLDDLIEWMAGKKFANDVPRNGQESDQDRWAFADPMHSRPLVLTFGRVGTDNDQPISKIFVGTNDGGFRLINEHTGVEEWVIYPNEMLNIQDELKINGSGPHFFGMDGTAVGRIFDANSDGIIDPADGDFVHVYIGMRRGGHQILAYNVTPNAKLDSNAERSAVDTIVPELLWRIDNTQADFARLGQTWSTPRPVRIFGPSGPQTVLIFAAGHSAAQDGTDNDGTAPDGGDVYKDATTGDSEGNAIYIVDANTGERLWWVSSDSTADKVLTDMNVAMPAPITTFDSNGDGFVDRVYAVDLRGQVFRVDIESNTTNGDFSSSTAGVLARLGDAATNADRRKFFYSPAVASVDDSSLGGGKYELIGLISGNRSQPQGKTVQDRAYGIRDYLIAPQKIDSTASNYPACNPLQPCTAGTPINHSSLINVTEAADFVLTDADDPDDPNEPIDNLRLSRGWYFDLEGTLNLSGEKGFSPATVLDGKMFFTTYLPPDDTSTSDDCSAAAALGFARFYAVDFFTGAPAFEFFDGGEGFTKEDRYKSLGAGPSADVVPAYLEPGVTLIVPTGAGALPQDPQVSETIFKSFWFQER